MSASSGTTIAGYRIRVIRPSASPIEHALEDGRSVFVGASDSCGIQVKGEGVANIHCLIEVEGSDVYIQDWASNAGTIINGSAIEDKTPVKIGDSIVIGKTNLVLAGGPNVIEPDGNTDSTNTSQPRTQEPREESIGMELLGIDESVDTTEPEVQPQVVDDQPIVAASTGRLSDSFAPPAVEPIQERSESTPVVSEQDQPSMLESHPTDSDAQHGEPSAEPEQSLCEDLAELEPDSDADDFESNHLTADDLDWDPAGFEDDEEIDPEIVQLLKSEIEDLRIQIAERDEQIATMERLSNLETELDQSTSPAAKEAEQSTASDELVTRVDDLLAELAEHDERVETLQELLQTAEIQNQAEREERNCLESWVGEIEQRIGQRESEWQAETDALRERLDSTSQQRDQLQQQLHAVSKRIGGTTGQDAVPDETLQKLQKQNAELQTALEQSHKQCVSLTRQVDRLQSEEPESVQAERAELAKQKAEVSRIRFELSKRLQDVDEAPVRENQPDGEFTHKLQALRQHLREIHEEEKLEREQRGESLFGRISGLWKRVEDRY